MVGKIYRNAKPVRMENRRVFKAINTNPNSWLFCRGSSGQENRITAYNELRKVIIYYLNKKEIDSNEDELEDSIQKRKYKIKRKEKKPSEVVAWGRKVCQSWFIPKELNRPSFYKGDKEPARL